MKRERETAARDFRPAGVTPRIFSWGRNVSRELHKPPGVIPAVIPVLI